jgi:nucleoside-diphosphate-sugar epimerase
VQLLLLRGETSILILDIYPPRSAVASHPSVTFIRTDITALQSLRDVLTSPEHPAVDVIYFTAAAIRFWERSSYSWPLSYDINVRGVGNVLRVIKEVANDVVLVYTSSAETAIPSNKLLRLGFDLETPPWNTVTVSDYDPPMTSSQASEGSYPVSKTMAERLVALANGQKGLRTGILRPGL